VCVLIFALIVIEYCAVVDIVTLLPMRPPVALCVSIVNIVSACVAVTILDMTAMM